MTGMRGMTEANVMAQVERMMDLALFRYLRTSLIYSVSILHNCFF